MSGYPPPPGPPGPPGYQPPGYPSPGYPGAPPPRRTPWLLIVAAAVVAVLLVVAVIVAVLIVTRDDGDASADDGDAPTSSSPTDSPAATSSTAPSESGSSSLAPPAPSSRAPVDRSAVIGSWRGGYLCGQGETRLRLDIEPGAGATGVVATFAFGPTKQNPDVPRGSFRMEGVVEDGRLQLEGTDWIKQPSGYVTVDLAAPVEGDAPEAIHGQVVGAGCTSFDVERR